MFCINGSKNKLNASSFANITLLVLIIVIHFVKSADIKNLCQSNSIDASLTNREFTFLINSNSIWTFNQNVNQINGPLTIKEVFERTDITPRIDAAFHIFPDQVLNDDNTRRMSPLAFVFKGNQYYILHVRQDYKTYELYSRQEGVPFGLNPNNGKGPISSFNFNLSRGKQINAALFKRRTHEALIFVDYEVYILNLSKWDSSSAAPIKKRTSEVINFNGKIDAAFELGDEEFIIIVNYQYCRMSWSNLNCVLKRFSEYLPCNGIKPSTATTQKTSNTTDKTPNQTSGSKTTSTSSTTTGVFTELSSESSPTAAIIIVILLILVIIIIITTGVSTLIRKRHSSNEENPEKDPKNSKSQSSPKGFIANQKSFKQESTFSDAFALLK